VGYFNEILSTLLGLVFCVSSLGLFLSVTEDMALSVGGKLSLFPSCHSILFKY